MLKPLITDKLSPGHPIVVWVSPDDEDRIKESNPPILKEVKF